MFKGSFRAACCAAVIFSNIAAAEDESDCGEQPTPPSMPEEANRTHNALTAARAEFVDYQRQNGAYLDCLIERMDALQLGIEAAGTATASDRQRKDSEHKFAITGMTYNQAVKAEHEAALSFNQALEQYQRDEAGR